MKKSKGIPNLVKLVICIAIPLIAGFIGSFLTTPSIPSWYASQIKPSFNPPNWIFGPVWTFLFILMGVSLYLIWTTRSKKSANMKAKVSAYWVFAVQLILNVIWSLLFFYLHCPLCAFVEIILLWASILMMIVIFRRVSKTAAYLQILYICWVSFASVLNFMIFWLNK